MFSSVHGHHLRLRGDREAFPHLQLADGLLDGLADLESRSRDAGGAALAALAAVAAVARGDGVGIWPGGVHSHGATQNGWFLRENPLKMDDWGIMVVKWDDLVFSVEKFCEA